MFKTKLQAAAIPLPTFLASDDTLRELLDDAIEVLAEYEDHDGRLKAFIAAAEAELARRSGNVESLK